MADYDVTLVRDALYTAKLTGFGVTMLRPRVIEVEGPPPVDQMVVSIVDPVVDQAPAVIMVVISDAVPESEVEVYIDDDLITTVETDSEGAAGPISIEVDADHGAQGSHTLTIKPIEEDEGLVLEASAEFEVVNEPDPEPTPADPDEAPEDVEGRLVNGVYRWTFQDLMPGGLGSYIFPFNPSSTDPWPFTRTLVAQPILHGDKAHVWEAAPQGLPWSFSGRGRTQEFHDKLVAFGHLKRRFYLIDHRNRAWKFVITHLDIRMRLRERNHDGTFTDWTFDYTVRGIIFGKWTTPVEEP